MDQRLRKGSDPGPGGCILWRGPKTTGGYGLVSIGHTEKAYAHRIAYELAKGPIPSGMLVCHTCDVRNCINPDHLWLGTISDNNRDAMDKGRSRQGPDGRFQSLEDS